MGLWNCYISLSLLYSNYVSAAHVASIQKLRGVVCAVYALDEVYSPHCSGNDSSALLLRAFSRWEWILPCPLWNDFRRAPRSFVALNYSRFHPRVCARARRTSTGIAMIDKPRVRLFYSSSLLPVPSRFPGKLPGSSELGRADSKVRREAPLGSAHFKMNFFFVFLSLSLSLSFSRALFLFFCFFFRAERSGRMRLRRESSRIRPYFFKRIRDFLETRCFS